MKYTKYFKDNEQLLEKLESLHKKKENLKKLIDKSEDQPPFIVELSGLPRTGKSTSIERVYDFFKFGNITIEKTDEPAYIIKNSMKQSELDKLSNVEFNDMTLKISKEELDRRISHNPSIIIQDRGVIDNYFWYQMMYNEKTIDYQTYENILLNLKEDLIKVDQIFMLSAHPEIIIFRDYINSIYLEDRKKTTLERVTELKKGFDYLIPKIENQVSPDKIIKMDTSFMDESDTAIYIADTIVNGISKKLTKTNKNTNRF